jgi:hypothetical protein
MATVFVPLTPIKWRVQLYRLAALNLKKGWLVPCSKFTRQYFQ